MPPEFSVIIPTRGDSSYLRTALGSALSTGEDLEVLLVHDRRPGSDGLPEELTSDSRVRALESSGSGPAATRNAGIDAARGAYVALLDDDDLWLPDHLGCARELLRRDPDAVLAACDAFLLYDRSADGGVTVPDDPSDLPRFDPGVQDGAVTLRQMLLANRILTPTVVMVRERLRAEDRFCTDLTVMEDYDLWLRLARRHPLAFDARPSVIVRRRDESASRNLRMMAREGLEVLARFHEAGIPPGTLSAGELRRRLGRLWHDLAYACLVEDDLPEARRALGESVARLPLHLKNYIYFTAGALPGPLRRRWFSGGRRLRAADSGSRPPGRSRDRGSTDRR